MFYVCFRSASCSSSPCSVYSTRSQPALRCATCQVYVSCRYWLGLAVQSNYVSHNVDDAFTDCVVSTTLCPNQGHARTFTIDASDVELLYTRPAMDRRRLDAALG